MLEALLESMPFIAFVKDENSRYLYANLEFERLMERPRSEIVGATDSDLFSEEGARRNVRNDRQVLATGEVLRTNETLQPGGVPREFTSVKFAFEVGGRRLVGGMVYDVTEQRRIQRAVTDSQARLKAALEAGYDAFFILDAVRDDRHEIVDFVIVDVNRNGERVLERTRWELVGHRLTVLLPERAEAGIIGRFARVLETRTPSEEEFTMVNKAGETQWYRNQVVPLGEGIAITLREITGQKQADAMARQHTQVLENSLGGIALVSKEGLFTFVNGEFCRMLGMVPEELVGQPWDVAVRTDDLPKAQNAAEQLAQLPRVELEVRGRRQDKATLVMRCVFISVSRDAEPDGFYFFAMDVTEQRRYERMLEEANVRLREQAATDALTGVRNRREFDLRLEQEIIEAKRYERDLAVVMMDVDKFKAFNDEFGHPAGDDVLRRVAGIVVMAARGIDVVARYGGEEFVVLLPDTDLNGARQLAERFRRALEGASWPLRQITASFGCAALGEGKSNPESLIAAADRALYAAKAEGRNRVCVEE
ncbi:diguanylate cyclase [Fimbriimonas ginsengisoli Gsoil 348]|uniref:Diguanylate cyclase n=2 Tax=Fimbriimonas ginsengisoli TaxID=1005039 RepID=A0A068NVB0_FIMGI|nr:diguanylate cyclase [Fimbriimonas ginsengisoli Gsoil 348]